MREHAGCLASNRRSHQDEVSHEARAARNPVRFNHRPGVRPLASHDRIGWNGGRGFLPFRLRTPGHCGQSGKPRRLACSLHISQLTCWIAYASTCLGFHAVGAIGQAHQPASIPSAQLACAKAKACGVARLHRRPRSGAHRNDAPDADAQPRGGMSAPGALCVLAGHGPHRSQRQQGRRRQGRRNAYATLHRQGVERSAGLPSLVGSGTRVNGGVGRLHAKLTTRCAVRLSMGATPAAPCARGVSQAILPNLAVG